MNPKRPIIISLILILATLFTFSSCSNVTENTQPEYIYLSQYIELPAGINTISNACYYNGSIYCAAYGNEAAAGAYTLSTVDKTAINTAYNQTQLYKINIDGSGYEQLSAFTPLTIPAEQKGYVILSGMAVDSNENIWLLENCYYEHFDEEGNWLNNTTQIFLRQLDSTGAELNRYDLSGLAENKDSFYLKDLLIGDDNCLYTASENEIYAINTNGEIAFTLQSSTTLNGINLMADGSIFTTSSEDNQYILKQVDSANQRWGESIAIPTRIKTIYNGSGEHDFFYSDQSNLYGYKISGRVEEKFINWIDSDINNTIADLFSTEDGRFICLSYNAEDNSNEIIVLTKTDRSQIKPKTTLTLGCIDIDNKVLDQVIKFNKTNNDYRIQIKDYSEYTTEDSYSAILNSLNKDLASGHPPDIILIDKNMPVDQYAAAGWLTDLYPYIDQDSDLGGRENLVSAVFSAIAYEDMLPYITDNFTITTATGASRVVGTESGWSLTQLNSVLSTMPQDCTPFPNITQTDFLASICSIDMDQYLDWDNSKGNFTNENFIQLLEFCSTIPQSIKWEDLEPENAIIKSGKSILMTTYISDFADIAYYKYSFGEPITFKGYPGINGSAFNISNGLAISSQCANKDVAWDFISYMLSPAYQSANSSTGFPTNNQVLQQEINNILSQEQDGNFQLTASDVAQIRQLIQDTTTVINYDPTILELIQEAAADFFAGDKTAAATAAVIQNKVNAYLNEQLPQ